MFNNNHFLTNSTSIKLDSRLSHLIKEKNQKRNLLPQRVLSKPHLKCCNRQNKSYLKSYAIIHLMGEEKRGQFGNKI